MGEHLVLYVDQLLAAEAELAFLEHSSRESTANVGFNDHQERGRNKFDEEDDSDSQSRGEDEPLIGDTECRICQEEDRVSNLEVPCGCSGSLKFAHRNCVQHWCNEKGDITCEICHKLYQPGYSAPPPPSPFVEQDAIDISAGWIELHNPHFLAIAQMENQFYEADYDDYAASGARAAAYFRSALLIILTLIFMRHAWIVSDNDDDKDMSALFSCSAIRVVGFLLPCYIISWAVSTIQCRWKPQEFTSRSRK